MTLWNDILGLKVTKTTGASYTVDANDVIVGVGGSGARTIATPADGQVAGRILIIKDEAGNAATGNITFDPAGSVTVNGSATNVINTNNAAIRLYCDGTNWFLI